MWLRLRDGVTVVPMVLNEPLTPKKGARGLVPICQLVSEYDLH